MRGIRRHLSFANVISVIALFVALGGGTAVALNGSNTVQSDDLGPGAQVKAPDVAANSVNGSDVTTNSLSGADIYEASLAEVPSAASALLGGFGRSTGGGQCDPESDTFIPCAVVTRDLPARARVLVVAQARAAVNSGASTGWGLCHIGTTSGPLLDTETKVFISAPDVENLSLVGVTGPLPPGQHSFGIDCNEVNALGGKIYFREAGVTAVAISPD